jgi:anti-sigma regulatory factor (Ser/Thr protein kinase)
VAFIVRDTGRWREQRNGGDRGRGLEIVRKLMDDLAVEPGPDGTEVRMRRRLGGGARR